MDKKADLVLKDGTKFITCTIVVDDKDGVTGYGKEQSEPAFFFPRHEIESLTYLTDAQLEAQTGLDKVSNSYEAKKAAKIERFRERAEKARKESDSLRKRADQMSDVIPLGQPILIGHHSEKADRRYRERIHSTYRKSFESSKYAEELEQRAIAAEKNTSISSDDPEAIEKLKLKVEILEEKQRMMKEVNKLVKKQDKKGLAELGFSEARIHLFLTPDRFQGYLGYPGYALTNNGANIRSTKERIERLEKQREQVTTEQELPNGIKIVDNVEENRFQLFFPGKPSEAVRSQLKQFGFRWTPSAGCWQSYRNHNSMYFGKKIADEYTD